MKPTLIVIVIAALLLGFLLIGCTAQNPTSPSSVGSYRQISQAEAKQMMADDPTLVILDVRRQDEYDAGHIPGAILIPNESIGTAPPPELPDKEQTILIYCRSGNRSKQAAQKLANMGYTNIYEFGGINTWDGEITTETKPETDMKKATLSFDSFDGGGPSFSATADDPSILSWTQKRKYHDPNHEKLRGAGFTVTFTFTGIKPGATRILIEERSPIAGNYDHIYTVTVAEDLSITLERTETKDLDNPATEPVPTLVIKVGDKLFYAALEGNSSAEAFVEKLSEGPVTLELHDYGNFEKVGPLPWELPRNDETITTKPGDIILYQGSQITIYYDENTWSFTRLARIEGETRESLLEALGPSDTAVTLWIEWSE